MALVYIGIGSNLDEPKNHVEQAFVDLATVTNTTVLACSPLYQSVALGPGKQANFINAVASINTQLPADNLLIELQHIEARHNRQRTVRWGPRTLDLDILLFGSEVITSDHLTIPHRELKKRNFVLYPLYDLAPKLTLPCGTPIGTLLTQCGNLGLSRLQHTE